jgi:H+/Na+-translocating ferredoxin:NAD+ oxidoreductase subunit D
LSNSHAFLNDARPTHQLMMLVCLALIPGAAAQIHFLGWGILINLFICAGTAILAEMLILKLRNKPPLETVKDNSALLTGLLIGLAIPPLLPWWMSMVGVGFAIIIAKQIYGGLGFNPFNPAMVGYVLLLISFPVEMTAWLPSPDLATATPNIIESIQIIFFGQTSSGANITDYQKLADGFTMATPLDHSKTAFSLGNMTSEIFQNNQFLKGTDHWFWINLGYLVGGIYLLISRIIHWHIPVSFLLSIATCSTLLFLIDDQNYLPASFQLFAGATMLGAFFIATDPVTASTTFKGRIIYAVLIGVFVVVIRTFGGYPDAIAFAVLLLNIATPTIDHYTKPKVYGEKIEVKVYD